MKHKKLHPAKSNEVGAMLFNRVYPVKCNSIFNGIKASAVFLLLGLGGLHAQEATTATGGEASGTGGTASYSVGQVAYTTNTGTNGSVAQGVQHSYEISTIVGIDVKNINPELSVYPNPTTDILTLKVENHDNGNLAYLLFDNNGKLLKRQKLNESTTTIQMTGLVPATYFLKIINYQKGIKTFKIIKN